VPKKRFGQHFLTDPGILARIVQFSRIGPEDHVVEIGPGRGALTTRLAEVARTVTAVEIDTDLTGPLIRAMPANVTIIQRDALEVDYRDISMPPYALVANLPYNIATALVERFVDARASIGAVTVMVQKEVADRILSSPGGRDYGPLSIGIQYYARVESGFVLPPGAFRPAPRVHSRMIRLVWKPGVRDNPRFLRFVRSAFASRRKKLVNNLQAALPGTSREFLARTFEQHDLEPGVRPEDVSVEQFIALYCRLRDEAIPPRRTAGPI
jgi:16S rRNA (adenine1518-N6/adenine1519-N6)-dimethyltransferase